MRAPGPAPFPDGARIRLTKMDHDPCPIPVGTTGTVQYSSWVIDRWQVLVKWDIPRSLNMAMPPDEAEQIG